jgi:hypothetical protein
MEQIMSNHVKIASSVATLLKLVAVAAIYTGIATWVVVWDAIQRVPGDTALTTAAMIVLLHGQAVTFAGSLLLASVVFFMFRWFVRRANA